MNIENISKISKDPQYEKDEQEKINKDLDIRILELYALYNISKALHLSFALEEIFNGTIDIIGKNLKIDEFSIMLLDENNQELTVRAWYPNPVILPNIRFKIGEGICGMAAKTGTLAIIQDTGKESNFMPYKGVNGDIGAFLCVPLIGRDGDILGVFNIHKSQPDTIYKGDIKFYSEAAQHIAYAVEKAIIYKKVKETSVQDDLTGLYNRRYFFEYIERELFRAARHKKHFSILMIDIDHFKNFNDKNGHPKGDNVLTQTARLFLERLRYSDTVARYGGEEFICLLPETSKETALIVAEKLRKSVEQAKYDGGENQPMGKVTITVGAATYPDDAKSASELIDCADKALYLGKSHGRNTVTGSILIK